MVGGALGVSEVFGTAVRFRARLVTAFFALCCFWAARVGRFDLAFTCAVLLTRFARLVLVVRRFAMGIRLSKSATVVKCGHIGWESALRKMNSYKLKE